MNWRLLYSTGILGIGRWRQFPAPKHLGSPRGLTPHWSPSFEYGWRVLSHRFAEVDLAMKAKALSECSNPDELRGHWRKEPGFMAFVRSS